MSKKQDQIVEPATSFSKQIYIYNIALVTFVTFISLIIICASGLLDIPDISPLSTIVTAAFAELGLHTGFFIWKAKFENGRKYRDVNLISQLVEREE